MLRSLVPPPSTHTLHTEANIDPLFLLRMIFAPKCFQDHNACTQRPHIERLHPRDLQNSSGFKRPQFFFVGFSWHFLHWLQIVFPSLQSTPSGPPNTVGYVEVRHAALPDSTAYNREDDVSRPVSVVWGIRTRPHLLRLHPKFLQNFLDSPLHLLQMVLPGEQSTAVVDMRPLSSADAKPTASMMLAAKRPAAAASPTFQLSDDACSWVEEDEYDDEYNGDRSGDDDDRDAKP